jgi:hypothetical protein
MAQVLSYGQVDRLTIEKPPPNRVALGVGVVIFAALSLWAGWTSKGFLEADACTHYMFARHALSQPEHLTNVWGRPICTGLYAIPAAIGRVFGVRVMSCLLAVACGVIGYRIAKGQGYRMPALAAILLFAQPFFFLHSFSELTEIPFALVATAAFWAYQRKQWLVMTILVSITPMGRPEGFGLMVMGAVALVCHGRWYYLFLMPLPMVLWSYLGWLSWPPPRDMAWYMWLIKNWPWSAKSAYGSGPWYHFVGMLPVLVSPIVFPAFLVGVGWSLWRGLIRSSVLGETTDARDQDDSSGQVLDYARPKERTGYLPRFQFFRDHQARVQVMIAVIPLSILVVHSFLYARGLMASSGELRYLLCVSPLWALLCAKGWEWCWEQFSLPMPFLCAGIAAVLPIVCNMYWKVIPLPEYEDSVLAADVAGWYERTPGLRKDYPKIMATLPMIFYTMDISQADQDRAVRWGRKEVENPPPGTMLIWDPVYGQSNADANLVIGMDTIDRAGWVWIGNFLQPGGTWCNVYLSPKTEQGNAPDPGKYRTPRFGGMVPF